jgi:hypothetical protein
MRFVNIPIQTALPIREEKSPAVGVGVTAATATNRHPDHVVVKKGGGGTGKVAAVTTTNTTSTTDTTTTPVRIANPTFRRHNVEATDAYTAPVRNLARWLSDDPTRRRREFLTVRKGANVVARSEAFEKQQTAADETYPEPVRGVAVRGVVTANRKRFEVEAVQAIPPSSTKNCESDPVEITTKVVDEEVIIDTVDAIDVMDITAGVITDIAADITATDLAPSTVQTRRAELERLDREARRRARNPYGDAMKPTWGRPHPNRGLPSTAWKRTLRGTPPPKRTLAELP